MKKLIFFIVVFLTLEINWVYGQKVLILVANSNFRDEEYFETTSVLREHHISFTTSSLRGGKCYGMLGGIIKRTKKFSEVKDKDYDAFVIIGGSGASIFFNNKQIRDVITRFYKKGRVIAAICISPVTLANAGILKGKRATCFVSVAHMLKLKGANYTGRGVEIDGNIITANGPEVARQFGIAIVKVLSQQLSKNK